jgi:hypothetical protein
LTEASGVARGLPAPVAKRIWKMKARDTCCFYMPVQRVMDIMFTSGQPLHSCPAGDGYHVYKWTAGDKNECVIFLPSRPSGSCASTSTTSRGCTPPTSSPSASECARRRGARARGGGSRVFLPVAPSTTRDAPPPAGGNKKKRVSRCASSPLLAPVPWKGDATPPDRRWNDQTLSCLAFT